MKERIARIQYKRTARVATVDDKANIFILKNKEQLFDDDVCENDGRKKSQALFFSSVKKSKTLNYNITVRELKIQTRKERKKTPKNGVERRKRRGKSAKKKTTTTKKTESVLFLSSLFSLFLSLLFLPPGFGGGGCFRARH
tara:strand:+ start:351 stop:773 length:423 start_codon:yes stop_codon:yes gene_type:complete